MISITVIFWMYVILFGLIGGMRGWAREILVTFSVVLALFVVSVLERFVPFIQALEANSPISVFWLRSILLITLVFFGYQTPRFPKVAGTGKFARDKLQDVLLGLVMGAINGYLIFGTLWFYIADAGYPFDIIQNPDLNTVIGQQAQELLKMMPPTIFGSPTIYFAVAISFVFVLVVFL
ncbi:MAG: hypothetical protein CVU39_06910 [Chloroflexi bacterium HGW-Chloroflexi-10]|nr:MAG: hypothetical protein CVU39_06910 [Chloroflexi bacterium HGW-Chloroflexi-10]